MKIHHFFSSCAVIGTLLTSAAFASDLGSVDSEFTAVQVSKGAWLDTLNDFMLEFSSQGVGDKEYAIVARIVSEMKSQKEFSDLLSQMALLDRLQDLYSQNGSPISIANLIADRAVVDGLLDAGLVAMKNKMFQDIFELELGLINENSSDHSFKLEFNAENFNKVIKFNGLGAVLRRIVSTYSQDLVTSEIMANLTEAKVMLSDVVVERLFENLGKAYFIHNTAAANNIAVPLAQLMTDYNEDLNVQLEIQMALRNRTIHAFLREKANGRLKAKLGQISDVPPVFVVDNSNLGDTPIDTTVLDQILPDNNQDVPAPVRELIETAGSVSEAEDRLETTEEETAGKKSEGEAAAAASTDEKAASPRKSKLGKIKNLLKRKSKQVAAEGAEK